jgi:hypothetical protein
MTVARTAGEVEVDRRRAAKPTAATVASKPIAVAAMTIHTELIAPAELDFSPVGPDFGTEIGPVDCGRSFMCSLKNTPSPSVGVPLQSLIRTLLASCHGFHVQAR